MVHAGGPPALPDANGQKLHMINEYFAVDVTSVAMDGVAPESNQEGSLREKQPQRSTAGAHL